MIKVDVLNEVVSNYIHDNNLKLNIDYYESNKHFSLSEYPNVMYIEYNFVDESHEDIIRLLLL